MFLDRFSTRALLAFAGVVVVAATVGIVAVTRMGKSPDAKRFLSYVHVYGTDWYASDQPARPRQDRDWIKAHPKGVLAAGRRACDWLGTRNDAPELDPSGRSDASAVGAVYTKSHADLPLATYTRLSVVAGAWNYLCPDTRDAKTSPSAEYDDD